MSRSTPFHLFGCLAFAVALAACAHDPYAHTDVLYVAIPPPPNPVEIEGSAPSPSYVWVTGRYEWNGVEYVWLPGQWEPRPNSRATWISGQWTHTRRGWIWVDGHWT